MDRRRLFAIVYSAMVCLTTVWYLYQIFVGDANPVLATWLIFALASSASLFTYLRSGAQRSLTTNIANVTSSAQTVLLATVLWLLGTPLGQNRTEVICFCLVGSVMLYYWMSRQATRANIALNVVMAIAYIPTLSHLWTATRNSESFILWGIGWVGMGFACRISIQERDWLATTFAARSFILTTLILALMTRLWWFAR